jgi:hypothetical protein
MVRGKQPKEVGLAPPVPPPSFFRQKAVRWRFRGRVCGGAFRFILLEIFR